MNDMTLNHIVDLSRADLSRQWHHELESYARVQAIKNAVDKQGIRGLWDSTRDEISRNVEAVLDVPLLDVLRGGWAKARMLARYRDRETYPPDTTYIAPLTEHTIRSRHRPHLEIRINQQPAGRIDFDLLLEMVIKGLRLHIRDARIRKIDTGEFRAKAKLSCEGFPLAQREWRKFALPGSIDLGEGVEI